jgi:hypothetical protein
VGDVNVIKQRTRFFLAVDLLSRTRLFFLKRKNRNDGPLIFYQESSSFFFSSSLSPSLSSVNKRAKKNQIAYLHVALLYEIKNDATSEKKRRRGYLVQ